MHPDSVGAANLRLYVGRRHRPIDVNCFCYRYSSANSEIDVPVVGWAHSQKRHHNSTLENDNLADIFTGIEEDFYQCIKD